MLFEKFMYQFIKDTISCGDTEYDITDQDIKEIIDNISDNDNLFITLTNIVDYELSKYRNE